MRRVQSSCSPGEASQRDEPQGSRHDADGSRFTTSCPGQPRGHDEEGEVAAPAPLVDADAARHAARLPRNGKGPCASPRPSPSNRCRAGVAQRSEPIKKAAWAKRRIKATTPGSCSSYYSRLPACLLCFPGEEEEEEDGAGRLLALLAAAVVISAVAAAPQLAGAAKVEHSLGIIQEDIIQTVNDHPNAGWTAGHNPYFANYTIEQFKHILGVKPTPPGLLAGVPIKTHPKSADLPKEFDARTRWSSCSTIGNILAASLRVNDLLACCGFLCGSGCNGGYPISAWRYFRRSGVVTEECDPYFDQTGCQHPGCEPAYPTPKCHRKCKVENQVWKKNKHFSVNAYRVHSNPHDIMAEVYKNGPVEVAFTVYEDFAHYKSGVYKHITVA
ncbi:hypothetical protein ZWY2020_053486 [Hordeum vulgare]|nr:hypothetical protein ZWY2020_053486 [Hordeum vulgare]